MSEALTVKPVAYYFLLLAASMADGHFGLFPDASQWYVTSPNPAHRYSIDPVRKGWVLRHFIYETNCVSSSGEPYRTHNSFILSRAGDGSFRRVQWHYSGHQSRDPTPFHGEWTEDKHTGCLTVHFSSCNWPEPPAYLKTSYFHFVGAPGDVPDRYEGYDF